MDGGVRVCLIIPPSEFLLDERVFVSLGVLKVAAALESRCEVSVLDLSGQDIPEHFPLADVYGVTATTAQMPAAGKIRARLDGKAVLGGAHATLCHAAKDTPRGRPLWLQLCRDWDVIVAGDGERAVFDALAHDASKVINADDPKGDYWLSGADLETAPLPARHLVDMQSYHYEIDGERALSMIAQLGCPFGCAFCGGRSSPFLRRIRTRSTAAVVAEMVHLHETYGVRGMMFLDDELNVNPRVVELMRAIRDTGIGWRLRGFIKAELFNDAQAEAMYEAGFRELLVGFESGSERILESIEKRANVADNTLCVATAKRHGLRIKALTSLGHPGESLDTIRQTWDWLLAVAPADFDATIITPYPGTPYFDRSLPLGSHWVYTARNGDRLHMEPVDYTTTSDYYKGIPGSYRSHVWTDHISASELVAQRDALEADVRARLGISAPKRRHESSMGQGQAA